MRDYKRFRVWSQARSNLAKGASPRGAKAFGHYIEMAIGSANELETDILLSQDLGFLMEDQSGELLNKLNMLRGGLINLRKRLSTFGD